MTGLDSQRRGDEDCGVVSRHFIRLVATADGVGLSPDAARALTLNDATDYSKASLPLQIITGRSTCRST
jgi:hypothetical protein